MSETVVLASIDLAAEHSARAVIREASFEAAARGLPLTVVAVVPEAFTGLDWRYVIRGTKQQVPAGEHRELIRQTLARVNELVSEETPEGTETDTLALLGVVYEKVLAAARELQASLVVIAAGSDSKSGMQDLGPNATRVARHASCPVLLVRDGTI
jgi:nucleotide-binding universal stress UspA family protein